MIREYTEDMGEISGFGGEYEEACRRMVFAGLDWLEANPDADPKYESIRGVYGLMMDTNDDAKTLDKVVEDVEPECTGAMHQACISTILYIRKFGWESYVEGMRKQHAKHLAEEKEKE